MEEGKGKKIESSVLDLLSLLFLGDNRVAVSSRQKHASGIQGQRQGWEWGHQQADGTNRGQDEVP